MYVEADDRIMKTTKTASLGIMQKTHLIECVRLRPCIWDTNHESFKSSNARQAAFNEIARMLSDNQNQYTRSHMQDEWGKIRYCFTRIIKKFLSTDDEAEAVSWPYWQKMQFLYEIVKEHLLTRGSSCDMRFGSKNFHRQNRSSRGRTRLSNQRFASSTPQGLSPNSLLASNVVSAISNQRHFTCGPTHSSASSIEPESLPRSDFDLVADQDDRILANHCTKQEEDENKASHLAKRPRAGEECQQNWAHATQQFLSALDSLPTSSTGVSSSGMTVSMPQNGHKGGAHQTMATSEIVNNCTPNKTTNVESGEKDVDTTEYFGKYMVQQVQCISRKNQTLGVYLRKELMDLIFKYELKAFSSS